MNKFAISFLLLVISATCMAQSVIPDSCNFAIVSYRLRNDLLIIPVQINDSLKANMILDPYCNSIILFGRRFLKQLSDRDDKKGAKEDKIEGRDVVLHNKVSIGPTVIYDDVPIVVLTNKNPLNFFMDVNGVIGYEAFSTFKIDLKPKNNLMTIKPDAHPLTGLAKTRFKPGIQ